MHPLTQILLGAAALAVAAAPSPAAVTLEVVATSGQTAPGTTGTFRGFDGPVLSTTGAVAFRATLNQGVGGVLDTSDTGLWLQRPGEAVGLVAREGSPAPFYNGTGTFVALDLPAVDALGHVAFRGRLSGSGINTANDQAVWQTAATWTPTAGGLWIVARENDSVMLDYTGSASSTYRFDVLGQPALSRDGTLLLNAWLKLASPTTYLAKEGVWQYPRPTATPTSSVRPQLVALEGASAPGLPGDTLAGEFAPPAQAAAAQVAVAGETAAGQGLWAGPASALAPVALSGGSAPGASANFALFGAPRANAKGELAWWAGTDSAANPEAVFLRRGGETAPLAVAGAAAPGGGYFASFFDPAFNERGTAAFRAALLDAAGNEAGAALFAGGAGAYLARVAGTGDAAPGVANATLAELGLPLLNELNQVAFTARLQGTGITTANDLGLWALNVSGALELVVREGSLLNIPGLGLKTVATFTAEGLNDAGQLAIAAKFTDGNEAVLRASLSRPALPDFAAWAAANIPAGQDASPAGDPNGDGVTNLMAFALGVAPTGPAAGQLPELALLDVSGLGAVPAGLAFKFTRRAGETAVTHVVEASADLVNWSSDPASLLEVSSRLVGGGLEEVVVRDYAPVGSFRFLRLRINP